MTLRDRCRAVYQKMQTDAVLQRGDPVEYLVEFVTSEVGRAADESLRDALSLVLYFRDEADREEFTAAILRAKPGIVTKRVP